MIDGRPPVSWPAGRETLALSELEIQSLIPGSRIQLWEPEGCNSAILFGVPEVQESGIISRPIYTAQSESNKGLIVPGTGIHYVESGKNYVFKLYPKEENLGKQLIVATDRKFIKDDEGGVVSKQDEDGVWTVTLVAVQEPVNLALSFLEETESSATGAAAVEDGSVRGADGAAYISSAAAGSDAIYSTAGALVKTVACTAGTTSIPLPAGFYIISLSNGENYKVAVK
ncbi:MAG: hypothetical protein LBL42_01690 [Tannerella sp.]|nr:hypothetical protein [Tannerella sp.]